MKVSIFQGLVVALSTSISVVVADALRLHELGQCPESKPLCTTDRCAGPITICPQQYRCTSVDPVPLSATENYDVIFAGCRCCPEARETTCSSNDCQAAEGSRLCTTEQLLGCMCWTLEDRDGWRRYWEREEGHLWVGLEEIEIEIEGEEDYGTDNETEARMEAEGSTTIVALATITPVIAPMLPLGCGIE